MEHEVVREKEEKEEEEEETQDAALIEFYSSFRDLFEFFCLNTTIHGTIRLVCSSSNKMKTAFWTLLFLASFAMMYWHFGRIFERYWSYPVIMSISVQSNDTKMFPAVTICNLNPYRIAQVKENIAELDNLAIESLYSIYGITIPKSVVEDNSSLSAEGDWLHENTKVNGSSFQLDRRFALVKGVGMNVSFELCNATNQDCYRKVYNSGVDAVQEWYRFHYMNIMSQVRPFINISSNGSHTPNRIRDFVYSCQYYEKPCNTSDAEYFHHPVYGSCYTLNSKGTNENWKALKPGITFGLSLILKVEQKDHIPFISTDTGVKVMIHNHNQRPFFEHDGFDVRPGIESTIGIMQEKVSCLGGNYGDCTNNGEGVKFKPIDNRNYTMQACQHSCFQQKMIEECGCGYYYYPLPPGAKYCNYNKHPDWGRCFYLLYSKLADQKLSCFRECPKRCQETWYKLSAGYAKWPSNASKDWIHRILQAQNGEQTVSNNTKDMAKVNIFFRQLNYHSWNESAEYPVTDAMSDMGGQWSLWFGSSVLSVVEMFEFAMDVAILSLIYLYRRLTAKRKHKITRLRSIPSVSLTIEKYRYVEEGFSTSENTVTTSTNASLDPNSELPPYSKYNRCQVPELYSSVVLNGFKHRKDRCADVAINR